jgi:thiol-disulfide isomerase/thioredoxin
MIRCCFILLGIVLFSAASAQPCRFSSPRTAWLGELQLNDSTALSFYFDILPAKQPAIEIYNAEEVIRVTEVTTTKDSLIFRMPVFDSEFRLRKYADSMKGNWINHSRTDKNVIAFKTHKVQTKPVSTCYCKPFEGKWEVDFSPGNADDHYKAVGIFRNPKCWDMIYGTFLTETGDYRYLSGSVNVKGADTVMSLSAFDGSHAFYFKAKKKNGTIEGDFYSGAHWHERWIAKRNDDFSLRNADSLTYLKPGYDKLDFRFTNLEGKTVSLSDDKYKNKVVIVQLMGSWCPNCMDETAYLAEFHKKYRNKGLEVIALAYEKTADTSKAASNVKRLKQKLGAEYEFLITGKTGKNAAAESLPMLNHVMAFPTTIIIDKKGKVRKIHTGFSGPGTGEYYTAFTKEFSLLIESLLEEK